MNANKILSFDRWDWLLTKGFIALVALLVPLFTVLLPTLMWIQDEPLEWTGPTGQNDVIRSAEGIAQDGVVAHWTDEAAVTIANAPADVWAASLLPGVVLSLATLSICWFLYRLITQIQSEKEFTRVSVWSLRGIALSLILGAAVFTVVTGIADDIVMSRAVDATDGPLITIGIAGPIIVSVCALVIAAIAEAFAHGANLQDDVEGLV